MPQAAFDYQTAADDGHADDDILDYLGNARGFNVDKALADGHSKQEVIQYLATHSRPGMPDSGGGQPSSLPSPSLPDDPGSPDAPPVSQFQPAGQLQPGPASLPGPGAGGESGSAFGTFSGMTLQPPPGYHQGLFQPNEMQRRAQKMFDLQAEWGARGAEAIQLERSKIQASREEILQRVSDMKANGEWEGLTPRQKAEIRAGGKNITPELRPINEPGYISADVILKSNPNAVDGFGNPLVKGDFLKMRTDPATGIKEFFPEAGGTTKRNVIEPDGKSYLVTYNRNGIEMGREEVLNPALLPKETSSIAFEPTQTGGTAAVPTTVFTRPVLPGRGAQAAPPAPAPAPVAPAPASGRNGSAPAPALPPFPGSPAVSPAPPPAAAAAAPASGASVGTPTIIPGLGKGFSPEEKQAMRGQLNQAAKTIGTVASIQDNLSLLNNLIDAKKIQFAMEPGGLIHSFVARNVGLTKAESKLAADFTQLTESINELRGSSGFNAAGFRGQEAFGKLQAQAGSLLGNPDITREVLRNTMDALLLQKDALKQGLNYGLPPAPGSDKLLVYSPQGKPGTVDRERIQEFLRKGYHLMPTP